MLSHLRPALTLLLALSLITGVAYPLAVTGLAQLALPKQAAGSLVEQDGRIIGSSLIGQPFAEAKYFHGRPSAAGAGYDATASSGSNLGPTSKKLHDRVAESVAALKAENPGVAVPAELVFASASGLDPDIGPAAARFQVPRIASVRGLPESAVQALVDQHTDGPGLGVFGEATINVLSLNRALDALKP